MIRQQRSKGSRVSGFLVWTSVLGLMTLLPLSTIAAQQAAQSSVPKTLQELIEAAKMEGGKLDIMHGSVGPSTFVKIGEDMSKKYGFPIRINVAPGPTPSALAPQLVQEFKAGRPASSDIFMGDDVNAMVQIEANSLFDVDWNLLSPEIPNEALGPKGAFVRHFSRIMGNVWYNTNLVTSKDVPQTLRDTLNPKWKGRLATTSFVAGFREAAGLFGRDREMADFLKAFQSSGNLAGFIRGGASDRIASGEFAMMVVAPVENPVLKLRSAKAPIGYTVLQDMPYVSYWVNSIPKHSARPNLAKLFAVYLMTREGQDAYYETEFADLHFLKGSKTGEEFRKDFSKVTPVTVTNEILLNKWKDYERVVPLLTQALRGGR